MGMSKWRMPAPHAAEWPHSVESWLDTMQTDVFQLLRRMPMTNEALGSDIPSPLGIGTGSSSSSSIPFRNDSGEVVPAYGAMQISGATVVGDQNYTKIIKPNIFGSQYGVILNGSSDVAAGATGNAQGTYPATAIFDTGDGSPGLGDNWGPRSGTWFLKKNTGGFRIGGFLSGQLALVTLAPWIHFRGQTGSAIAANDVGTVRIYWAGSYTGFTVQAQNDYDALDSGVTVTCAWIEGQWNIIAGC